MIKNIEEAKKIVKEIQEEGYIIDFEPADIVGTEMIKQLSGLNKREPHLEFMLENSEVYAYNENDMVGDDYIYFIKPEKIIESEAFYS